MTDPESPEDQFNLDPVLFAGFERLRADTRANEDGLSQLEKIGLRKAAAEARMMQAEATEAQHRAAMEPRRQRMALKERETKRVVGIILAVFAMAYLVGALLLAPWVIPPTGIAAALASYLWRRSNT